MIKGLALSGPILLPVEEDLPHLAKPLSCEEKRRAMELAGKWGMDKIEETAPVTFIGSGATMNVAIDNGLTRAAEVLEMSVPEVKNRATVSGAIEIGRAPGVVMVTFRCPVDRLGRIGLLPFVKEQYDL